jgi:hypothetical protein
MKTRSFITTSILIILMYFSQATNAQTTKSLNYSRHPYWIEMMNDPNVNYFEAIKAYDAFWANRKKPMEENEVIGESKNASEKRSAFQRWFETKEQRKEEEAKKYTLDVKKFEHWKMKVKPYVQEDGSILSNDQLLKLWEERGK